MEWRIAISKNDLFKLEILRKVELGILKQIDAAKELNLDVRQVRRLSLIIKELGPKGLISKKECFQEKYSVKGILYHITF